MTNDEIEAKIKKLPEHLIPEVLDFIEFLSLKNKDIGKKT